VMVVVVVVVVVIVVFLLSELNCNLHTLITAVKLTAKQKHSLCYPDFIYSFTNITVLTGTEV